MPVIDDPRSMIRCTNKVYLAERLSAAGVPTPRTVVVQGVKQAAALGDELGWPVVLKIPDGSFSRGVFKCDDLECLKSRLKELLDESDLVIAQEFVPTAFDWRIGVLAGEALFACQYHMVKKHWQIMKYEDGKTVGEGRFTTCRSTRCRTGWSRRPSRRPGSWARGSTASTSSRPTTASMSSRSTTTPISTTASRTPRKRTSLWEKLVKWFWDRLEA
jgi:biotin carboxylase